jgi:PKD repeat protein
MRRELASVSFVGKSSWLGRFGALLVLAGAAGGCAGDNAGSQGTLTETSAAITFGTVNLPATTATLNITLPPLTPGEQAGLAFGARNALTIDSRLSTTGLGASAATVVMGTDGTVGAVTATGAVTIGDRSHVTGALRTGATATLGSQATAGSLQQHLALPPTTFTNTTVTFPAATRNATAAPNEVATLAAGSYGQVTINAGARITLNAGTYNFRGLDLEPQAQLIITGPVTVNVAGSLVFRGTISDGGDATRFRLFYFGTAPVRFDTPFRGRVIAPAASLILAAGNAITGFCYAASLEVSDGITWTPIASPLGGIVATPTLTATGVTFTATQGVPFSGVVANFTDSITTDTTANFTASISWGDGTTSAGTVGGANGAFTVSGTHTYAATGTFAVTVTITQTPSGVTAVATSTGNVGKQLAASGVMFSATQGVPFTGQVATFTDAVTTDTAASFTASINWGDGTTSAGVVGGMNGMFTVSGTHTYAQGGTFTVTVSITDTANGATATATSTALVGAQLAASGVMFTATQGVAFTGLVANLHDASTTDTAAAFTATIAWGDGTTSAGTVAGGGGTFTVSGTHTYASAGTFTVTTSVVDTVDGATATATSTALVGRELTATGVTFNATAGVAFSGTVANLTDANTSHPASSFTASIAWGDGSTSAGVVGGASGTFTVSGTHTYAAGGTFTVTVSITNTASGATATATSTAIVNSTLSATGVTFSAIRGVSFTGVVANLSDTNTGDAASAFTATIAWGDGTTSAGTITGGGGAFTISGTHTYAATGTFTLTISVSQTGATATAISTALVGTELGATGINITALVGVPFSGATASVTDADTSHTAATFTATISWGDGATSAGTITGASGAFTVAGTHTYATTGTFNVTVSITNTASGATATTTSTATVVSAVEFQAWGTTFRAAPGVSAFQGILVGHLVDGNPAAGGTLTGTADWGDGSSPSAVFFVGTPLPGNFDIIGNHTFSASGTFNVTLSITDTSNGATTSATAIAQVAPQLLATGKSFTGTPGVIMNSVLVAHVSDTNPTDSSASFNVTVDWGDNSGPQSAIVAPSGPAGSFDVFGNHTYNTTGTFTIHVSIAAPSGATATTTSTAVIGLELAVTGVTFNASPGVSFNSQTIGHLSDTDLGTTASAFTATVDWGDGATGGPVTIVSTPAPGVFDLAGSHIYTVAGTFTVQISVTRNSNGASATGNATARVASPLAGAGAQALVPAGVPRQILVAHVTDGNPLDGNALTALIDWGDGSSASQGTVLAVEVPGTFDVLGSHTYRTDGTFPTTTTVTGPGGASVTLTGSVSVRPEPLFHGVTFNATPGVTTAILLGHLLDPNPADSVSSFTAFVEWNDGSGIENDVAISASGTPGVYDLASTRQFASTGTFRPVVHITRIGSTVEIGGIQPTAQVVAPSDIPALFASDTITQTQPNVSPASPGLMVASFVDADLAEPTSNFSVTIEWGDGTTSSTSSGSSILISPVASPVPSIPTTGTFNVFSPHTYTTVGGFMVKVTISSSASGASTSTISNIDTFTGVVASPTVIKATPGSTPPFPGFLVASFTDEIPFLLPSNYAIDINWGDGTPTSTSPVVIVPVGAGGNQYDVFASHTYASFGTFPVSVEIISQVSGSGGIANSTAILSQPLHASGTAFSALPNVTPPSPGFLVASVVDDDLAEGPNDLAVTVDWGDNTPPSSTLGGSVSVTLAGPPGSGLFDVFSPHSYAHPGSFPVTVTITSAVSKGSATASSVASASQQIIASGTTITAVPGIAPAQPGFVVASFVDSNTTEGAPQFEVTVEWGDGTTSSTPTGVFVAPPNPGSAGTFDVFSPHTFASSGSFTITVTITSTATGTTATTTSTAQVVPKLLATGATLRAGAAAPLPPGAGGSVVASVIDPGLGNPSFTLAATIDWGDGSPLTTTGTTTNGVLNTFLLTGVADTFDLASTHAYATTGTFTATITITDTSTAPATTTTTATFTVLP